MELRVLRYFLTVAEEGNITKAAEILHITQPTLSRQLAQLEEELGISLFMRGKKQIILTEEGLLLQLKAKEIVELADNTERQFINLQMEVSGLISIGCVESVGTLILPELISSFVRKYPNVKFDIYTGYGDDIKEKIDRGLLDIGIVLEPIEISKYSFIRLPQKEVWGVLMRRDDVLSKKECISLEDIKNLPLIIPKRSVVKNEIENWFIEVTDKINVFATYNLISNVIPLVQKGLGYAICLKGALSLRDNSQTGFTPFIPKISTQSVVIWKKNYIFNSATSLFINMSKIMTKENKN
ncbi:LysR family transcriptional regulator [Clostridium felsineum]|uniref:LysR family transcriptional regulator n=1 Tax=Clostridium felsineum TaxID=36839 RepID=UPI00214DC755|nr:LysR family transcriptional regulator [Clostridium felsineum]MCR3761336.1 LysR family transcriptional regulator [Clostridium felsineum]